MAQSLNSGTLDETIHTGTYTKPIAEVHMGR